jgi:hypothetical protein
MEAVQRCRRLHQRIKPENIKPMVSVWEEEAKRVRVVGNTRAFLPDKMSFRATQRPLGTQGLVTSAQGLYVP